MNEQSRLKLSGPYRLAKAEQRLQGTLSLDELPRLKEIFSVPGGRLDYRLQFYQDEQKRYFVQGLIKASLDLVCQRCMLALPAHIEAEFRLKLVNRLESQQKLDRGDCDILLTEQSGTDLTDLLSDELILALPPVSLHEPEKCSVKRENAPDWGEDEQTQTQATNPFAVLEKLKA